ncbi:MAG TPA: rhomboid family intramembrane serine protease [Bacteroidia bacterium]|nr:rhomboid family intramembrane serine protease [Bacteroidia bacterium]
MSSFIEDIKHSLQKRDTLQTLIIINVAVFLVINLSKVAFQLFNIDFSGYELVIKELAVPASIKSLVWQPWSIVTYAFLHENLLHILFNMLWLYWMGKILVEYLGSKKLLSTYILGGIAGAILYILFFNIFPLFSNAVHSSYALGASGSVLAITMAVATLLPDYTIFLLFLGPVKMKYIAGFSVLLDLISISGSNAGGHIAHLGGALFGFIYIRQLQKGNDLAKGFNKLADFISGIFKPKPKMKVAYKNPAAKKSSASRGEPDQETIDKILDKISRSGYTSLSKEEKEILFKASGNKKV